MNGLEGLYDGREQTLAKHEVLRRYLQRFAFIIGSWSESITYVDCYSGPWDERSEEFADTSFGIAIEQLRAAKSELGKNIRLRCFFIEQNKEAYRKLENFGLRFDDIEIETRNANFEDSVDDILDFVRADPKTFPFFLIDPKGWSIPLDVIRPLLLHRPGEVLITFMLEFIRRFVDHREPGIQRTFDALYGALGGDILRAKDRGGEARAAYKLALV
jgi:three-Cys-motif partner protein